MLRKEVVHEGKPGGMCRCCGAGAGDCVAIWESGIVDIDGVMYSTICKGCHDDITDGMNKPHPRQQAADMLMDLGDIDGAQTEFEDAAEMGMLSAFDEGES